MDLSSEKDQWETTYQKAHTGLGPANPNKLDNYDEKLQAQMLGQETSDSLVRENTFSLISDMLNISYRVPWSCYERVVKIFKLKLRDFWVLRKGSNNFLNSVHKEFM